MAYCEAHRKMEVDIVTWKYLLQNKSPNDECIISRDLKMIVKTLVEG